MIIPTYFYIMLNELSNNIIKIINNNNLKIFKDKDDKIINDLLNNLKSLNNNLCIMKDIQLNLINIKDNNEYLEDKLLILKLINNYEELLKLTNHNNLNYKFVDDLFQILKLKIDYLNINDLDQYYKLNDLNYLVLNNKFYKINIINDIIQSIIILDNNNLKNILNESFESYDIFRYNIKVFSEYFNDNVIIKYNDIKYYTNDYDIEFNREINFYKILFQN